MASRPTGTTRSPGFHILDLDGSRLLHTHNDGNFATLIFGFVPGERLSLPEGCTHFGAVVEGEVVLSFHDRKLVRRKLFEGDYFCTFGKAVVEGNGTGMVSSAVGYRGLNSIGGPIEEKGRLRYIDECTDSLLVPPVLKGDPCLNLLHFPPGITQTPHTHPSVRTGVIISGQGVCVLPQGKKKKVVPLEPGRGFVIGTGTLHSFNTDEESMSLVAFHPDTDFGPTHQDHPMLNRTFVKGKSARSIKAIQTKEEA